MKIYLQDNVYEAALKRTERIFNEFENIVVSISGGKDSTATMGIALEVARKLNRLPLKVKNAEDRYEENIQELMRSGLPVYQPFAMDYDLMDYVHKARNDWCNEPPKEG